MNLENSLKNLHSKINKPSNYIIDIGASTGVESDPLYEFIINSKFNGLCIEGDTNKIKELNTKTTFDICNEFIYPHNIINIFQKYNVPINIDILKVDIDGFDLEVIRKILEVYKPTIIITEINEKIPPPIEFEVLYKDDYVWDFSHCFGFSIKAGETVMNKFNYKILEIYELNNIICINEDLSKILGYNQQYKIEEIYNTQYVHDLSRHNILPWNGNVNYWLEIEDKNILKKEIIDFFCNYSKKDKYNDKILNIDFIVS